jgi:hypothetical protein
MRGQKRVEDARERAYDRASIEKRTSFKTVKLGNDGGWISADSRYYKRPAANRVYG